jgi:hypothetical protein
VTGLARPHGGFVACDLFDPCGRRLEAFPFSQGGQVWVATRMMMVRRDCDGVCGRKKRRKKREAPHERVRERRIVVRVGVVG